jgi:hypothetical protein
MFAAVLEMILTLHVLHMQIVNRSTILVFAKPIKLATTTEIAKISPFIVVITMVNALLLELAH